mmetsp:Transcript_36407/g.109303  ORF Transcript_36407/g.109303 Transcript_36407/m.109303 type:complete len:320 (-) Transcript_36407:459-1418(-)
MGGPDGVNDRDGVLQDYAAPSRQRQSGRADRMGAAHPPQGLKLIAQFEAIVPRRNEIGPVFHGVDVEAHGLQVRTRLEDVGKTEGEEKGVLPHVDVGAVEISGLVGRPRDGGGEGGPGDEAGQFPLRAVPAVGGDEVGPVLQDRLLLLLLFAVGRFSVVDAPHALVLDANFVIRVGHKHLGLQRPLGRDGILAQSSVIGMNVDVHPQQSLVLVQRPRELHQLMLLLVRRADPGEIDHHDVGPVHHSGRLGRSSEGPRLHHSSSGAASADAAATSELLAQRTRQPHQFVAGTRASHQHDRTVVRARLKYVSIARLGLGAR